MKKIIIVILRDCGFSLNFRRDRSLIYFGASFAILFTLANSTAPLWLLAIAGVNALVSLCVLKVDADK